MNKYLENTKKTLTPKEFAELTKKDGMNYKNVESKNYKRTKEQFNNIDNTAKR